MVRNQVHGDELALSRDEKVLRNRRRDYMLCSWDFKTEKLNHNFQNSGNPTTIIFGRMGQHLYISNMNEGRRLLNPEERERNCGKTSNTWKRS
jgi:hypothetical protein